MLALVGQGLSNAEIADVLTLSPATAKTHVSRAMVKLRARDRAQLVVLAYQAGLVGPGPPARPPRRPACQSPNRRAALPPSTAERASAVMRADRIRFRSKTGSNAGAHDAYSTRSGPRSPASRSM